MAYIFNEDDQDNKIIESNYWFALIINNKKTVILNLCNLIFGFKKVKLILNDTKAVLFVFKKVVSL